MKMKRPSSHLQTGMLLLCMVVLLIATSMLTVEYHCSEMDRKLARVMVFSEEADMKNAASAVDAALEQCISKRLYSANDFKAFAESLKKPEPEATPEIKPLGDESARMLANFDPGRSSISTYQGVWNS